MSLVRTAIFYTTAITLGLTWWVAAAEPVKAADRPNIVIIWGDDIGQSNISAYLDGTDGLPHPEHRPRCRARGDLH